MKTLTALALPLALCGTVAIARADTAAVEEAFAACVDAGIQRIGVSPLIQLQGGELSPVLSERYQRLGRMWASLVYDQLVQRARLAGGSVEVLRPAEMQAAMAEMNSEHLGDAPMLRGLRQRAGVDGLVLLGVEDTGDAKLRAHLRVVDLASGEELFQQSGVTLKTLSIEAYCGASWELRRWVQDEAQWRLANIGMELDGPEAFGDGEIYEGLQYASLRKGLRHPLSDPDCPYKIEVLVEGQPRPLAPGVDRFYVPLNNDEQYTVRLINRSPRNAYFALYIDGVNTIGIKEPEGPRFLLEAADATPYHRTWMVPAGKDGYIRGWWVPGEDGANVASQGQRPFVVAGKEASVAAGIGSEERVGAITAIVYAHGREDVPQAPQSAARSGVDAFFGTAAGAQSDVKLALDQSRKPKGPMLAAMTLHYRASEQLYQGQQSQQQSQQLEERPRITDHPDMVEDDETVAAPEQDQQVQSASNARDGEAVAAPGT